MITPRAVETQRGKPTLREPVQLGLIGYPLGHSRSPQLHHAALAAAGLRGSYSLFPIAPDQAGVREIEALLGRLRMGELRGLNVTIPHKGTVMPFLDHLSPTVQAVGAANTLYIDEQGRLCGENTDVPGFLSDLQKLTGSFVGRAVVLGAGGSARAVVYGLLTQGWQVRVLARRQDQAAQLIEEVAGPSNVEAGRVSAGEHSDSTLTELVRDQVVDLLVNTTPLGMFPQIEGCPWPENLPLPDGAAVYDLVYNPMETVLVRRARAHSLPAATGAGMLVAQAALAFSIWTGLEPPFNVMMKAF